MAPTNQDESARAKLLVDYRAWMANVANAANAKGATTLNSSTKPTYKVKIDSNQIWPPFCDLIGHQCDRSLIGCVVNCCYRKDKNQATL